MIEDYVLSGFFFSVVHVVTPFLPNCRCSMFLFNCLCYISVLNPSCLHLCSTVYTVGLCFDCVVSNYPAPGFLFMPIGKRGLILFTWGASGQQPLTTSLPVCLLAATMWNVTNIHNIYSYNSKYLFLFYNLIKTFWESHLKWFVLKSLGQK